MNMLASAKDTIGRKLATPSHKGYASLAKDDDSKETDRFYDEQLRSDGWHLDEVEDDDQLDFALPPSRASGSHCSQCCRIGCTIS